MDDQVTLTAYADQVRELIHNDRNDEAIAICKHILRYYPKYVVAYRQLGEAFLEKGCHADAKELFRRVLSADPENVVAYAGLAIVLEQEHLVAEAVWHMERAFELAPSNPELRQELQRLYHELEGRPRARLELTPGALARLYAQEGLFMQAVQEWNTIVAESATRFDARVALAETLWRIGQMRQAAETAQSILEALPYCLKANLILGTVWKETGLSESDQYLQRAQELDPTNQTAQWLFGAHSPLPIVQARVPRYVEGAPVAEIGVSPELVPGERAAVPAEPTLEPTREPIVFAESEFKPPVLDTTLPPWLQMPMPEAGEEQAAPAQPLESVAETSAPAPISPPTIEPQPEPVAETTGEIPAWLAELRQSAETTAETTIEAPAQPAEAPSAEAAPPLPSWIEQVQAVETTAPPLAPTEEPKPEAITPLPPWIAEVSHTEEAVPAPLEAAAPPVQPPTQASEEALPPWLEQTAPPTQAAVLAPTPAAPSVTPAVSPVSAPKRKRPARGDSHLVLARTYRDANQIKEALEEYDYIVQKAPRLVNQVISDLEILIKRRDVPLEAHRILGDAYTRADRLAEALEEYRFVLEHVS